MFLSLQEVHIIFNRISQYISDNSELLAVEGVFRLSAERSRAQSLISLILSDNEVIWSDYTIHECLTALKIALGEKALMSFPDQFIEAFLEKIKSFERSEVIDSILLMEAFDDFFQSINKVSSIHFVLLAETVYHYFYLAKQASHYQNSNKMTTENLATVSLPVLMNSLFGLSEDILLTKAKFYQKICAIALEHDYFLLSFQDRFHGFLSEQRQIKVNNCEKRIEQLRQEKFEKTAIIETITEKLSELELDEQNLKSSLQDMKSAQRSKKSRTSGIKSKKHIKGSLKDNEMKKKALGKTLSDLSDVMTPLDSQLSQAQIDFAQEQAILSHLFRSNSPSTSSSSSSPRLDLCSLSEDDWGADSSTNTTPKRLFF